MKYTATKKFIDDKGVMVALRVTSSSGENMIVNKCELMEKWKGKINNVFIGQRLVKLREKVPVERIKVGRVYKIIKLFINKDGVQQAVEVLDTSGITKVIKRADIRRDKNIQFMNAKRGNGGCIRSLDKRIEIEIVDM